MTIRDDLQHFLSEKPFSNPLTEPELDALAGWVENIWNNGYQFGMESKFEDDLAAKLRRLEEAGFTLENSPYIEDQYGRWSTAVIKIGDLPEAVDAAIAELERQEETK